MTFEEFLANYQNEPVQEYPNQVHETVPHPVVSCRVSTYQHAPYIRKCLDGILMQITDFPFEICIGDDESNDGTREICIEYAKNYPDKIRLFLHKRANNIKVEGKPSAKFQSEYTAQHCRGEFMALCEGDDYWIDPWKLQRQVDFMRHHPDVSACGHHCVHVSKNFSKLHRPFRGLQFFDKIDLYFDQVLTTCTVLVKIYSFDDRPIEASLKFYGGDKLLWHYYARKGQLAVLPDIMAVHLETGKGMGTGLDLKERERLIPIKRKITSEVYPYTTCEVVRAYGRKLRQILLKGLEIPRHPVRASKEIIRDSLRLVRAFREGLKLGFK